MSTISEFHEFAEALRGRYDEVRRAVPGLFRASGRAAPSPAAESLRLASGMLEATLEDLGAAADKLHEQNDALFAARVEMAAEGRFYRELFDLAPAAWVVTTPDGRITHANRAATSLFGRPCNALVGQLVIALVDVRERGAFRAAMARTHGATSVVEFPIRLLRRGASAIDCRVRVSARRDEHRARSLQWLISEDGSSDADLL